LVSGDPNTVHQANVSVRGKTRPEGRLKTAGLLKRIKKWPNPKEQPPVKKKAAKKAPAKRAAKAKAKKRA
jgi:hypothetical protein